MDQAGKYIVLLRPWFWIPGIAPILAVVWFCSSCSPSIWSVFLAICIAGPGLCAFAEIVNDIHDREIDSRGSQKKFLGMSMSGGSGVLNSSPDSIRTAVLTAIGSALLALSVAFLVSPACVVFVLAGLTLAWMYSAPPFRLKRMHLSGQIVQFLGYGPVCCYIGYAIARGTTPHAQFIMPAILTGLWTCSVGMTADVLDRDDDIKNNIKTLAVLLGHKTSLAVIAIMSISVAAAGILTAGHNATSTMLFAVVLIILATYLLLLGKNRNRALPPAIHALALILEAMFPFALFSGWRL